ncbi:hypothetical protein [Patulibacter defluvii]|uniref:hypothetical protein n=1 Tax=Patulibacter defluvii TaxID=3095358 RepID=UPI002A763296|nr:hypothetical protein [Patulibacter sp. DM4]
MSVPLLSSIGLVMLALGTVSGWVLEAYHRWPQWFKRRGVIRLAPLRQTHLDWIVMSLMLFAIDQVVPERPGWITGLIAYGAIVNPLLFLPLAFDGPGNKRPVMQVALFTSFGSLTIAMPALAVHGLTLG